MVSHEKRIKLDWSKPVSIFFFGDLQEGQEGFSKEMWEAFKAEVLGTPRSYAIGLGDYSDWLRPTMRARLGEAVAHDDSSRQQLDNMVRRDQDKFLDVFSFLEGKIIGLHSGHHEWDFGDGTNSTQRMCSAFKAPYLGWSALNRIVFELPIYKNSKPNSSTYNIFSMHGSGNGRSIGSDVNWLVNNVFSAREANCYVKGHSCKAACSIIRRDHPKMKGPPGYYEKIYQLICCGGFHNGWTDGWHSSYVERAGFVPQPLSWAVLRITLGQHTGKKRNSFNKHCASLDVEAVSRTSGMGISFDK